MNTDLLIVIVALVLFGGAFFLYTFFRKRYDLIVNTETSSITTLKKGFFEIKGKVNFLEEKLISPLSQVPCVYYKFKVEVERSSGKSSHWHTMVNESKSVRFAVQDHSGMAIIEMEGAKLKFNIDSKGRTGLFKEASEELERALSSYNKSSKGWFFRKTIRYTEIFVEEGDELFVIGEVQNFENYYPVFNKGKLPFLISDKSEEDLIKEAKRISRIALLLLFVFPVAAGLLLYYRNFVP